jgi:hypothetical protein
MANNGSTATGAAGAAAGSQNPEETLYTCKWGIVTILNRLNYTTFKASCRSTLIVAGAWSIARGADRGPIVLGSPEGKDWITRRDRGLQIIYNSTSRDIRTTLSSYMDRQDVAGLWRHLRDTYDQSNDAQFINDVLNDFPNDKYNPPNDTINAFIRKLLLGVSKSSGKGIDCIIWWVVFVVVEVI